MGIRIVSGLLFMFNLEHSAQCSVGSSWALFYPMHSVAEGVDVSVSQKVGFEWRRAGSWVCWLHMQSQHQEAKGGRQ